VVRVSPTHVHITDIAAVKEIHKVGGRYPKSPWYTRLLPQTVQTVFSIQDVSAHSRRRHLLSHAFSEASIERHESVVMDRVNLAIQRIAEEAKTRGAADVYKWWLFMATDVVGELSFGESFRMLEYGKVVFTNIFSLQRPT
jgi:cytochrome P450